MKKELKIIPIRIDKKIKSGDVQYDILDWRYGIFVGYFDEFDKLRYEGKDAYIHPVQLLLISGRKFKEGDKLTHIKTGKIHTFKKYTDSDERMFVTEYKDDIGQNEDWTAADLYYFKEQIVAAYPAIEGFPVFTQEFIMDWCLKPDAKVMVEYEMKMIQGQPSGEPEGVMQLKLTENNEVICSLEYIKPEQLKADKKIFSDSSETIQPLKELKKEIEEKSALHKCPKCGSEDICFHYYEGTWVCPKCGVVEIDEKAEGKKSSNQLTDPKNTVATDHISPFTFSDKGKSIEEILYMALDNMVKNSPVTNKDQYIKAKEIAKKTLRMYDDLKNQKPDLKKMGEMLHEAILNETTDSLTGFFINKFCDKHGIPPQALIDVYEEYLKKAVESVQDSPSPDFKKCYPNSEPIDQAYSIEEVRSRISMIYSEFADTVLKQNHITLRKIIEDEVEKHPIKPLKIFK